MSEPSRFPRGTVIGLVGVVVALGLALDHASHRPNDPGSSAAAGIAAESTHSEPHSALLRDSSRTRPTRLVIPEIWVSSHLMMLGLAEDRSVEVPPLSRAETAGWYQFSSAPGDIGAGVLIGHLDSDTGPAVFYRLAELRKGSSVIVHRSDGIVAEFSVDRVASYAKSAFPTRAVYGRIRHAGLRLITCGGAYDPDRGGYQENIVVFASLRNLTAPDKTARTHGSSQ